MEQTTTNQSHDDIESLHTLNRTGYGGLSERHSMIDYRSKEPMANIYRAIMPITGTTSRMGVTVST